MTRNNNILNRQDINCTSNIIEHDRWFMSYDDNHKHSFLVFVVQAILW